MTQQFLCLMLVQLFLTIISPFSLPELVGVLRTNLSFSSSQCSWLFTASCSSLRGSSSPTPVNRNISRRLREFQRARPVQLSLATPGGRASHVLRARLLVLHLLLRAQHQGRRDLPRQPAQHHGGRVHRPQPGGQVLSRSAVKH